MDARPRDVRDGRAGERLRQLAVAQLVPLRRVDDDPVGDAGELRPLCPAEVRLPAPADEHGQVRDGQRQHDRRRRERPVAVQVQLDHLAADGTVACGEAAHGEIRVDAALLPVRPRHEEHGPRRVPLRETGERPLRRIEPLRRYPGDVRHHARPLHRLARLGHPLRAELALDRGDRA